MTDIWLHGASVGDMRALAPLHSYLALSRPQLHFHVTAWTVDGRRLARSLFGDGCVGRPPIPLGFLDTEAIRRLSPRIAVFEYMELWPGWTRVCQQLGIPMVVVDGRITKKSLRIAPLLHRAAQRLTAFCAQTAQDASYAERLGVPPSKIHVMGNSKYDGFRGRPPEPSRDLIDALGLRDVVVGSLHPDEEAAFVRACRHSALRILVAPRYVSRSSKLRRQLSAAGVSVGQRTRKETNARVMILDSVGELASAYAVAPTAIIGGTFGRRQGQNLFEAALHNRRIIFGPHYQNVEVEVASFRGRGADEVADWGEAFQWALVSTGTVGVSTRAAIGHLRGAAERQGQLIEAIIDGRCAR